MVAEIECRLVVIISLIVTIIDMLVKSMYERIVRHLQIPPIRLLKFVAVLSPTDNDR